MDIAKEHYTLLCAACAALFTTPLMMAGVNAVLPEIGNSFQASAATLALVGASYSLGLAIFQLVTGSLGDIVGHRRLFLAGALLFSISSIFGAMAETISIFLLLRFLQGIGGAVLSATGLAMIASFAPPEKRASYLGLSGAAVYAGIACGPPVAGFITGAFDWRWIFWINAATNIGVFCIMKYSVKMEWRPASSQHFDLKGALLYSLVMLGLIITAGAMSISHLYSWLGFGLFLLSGGFFLFCEKRAKFPVLDLRLLASSRILRFSSWAALLNYSSLFGQLFYFSIYLQIVLKFSVQQTGLVLAIQALTQALVTPFATRRQAIFKRSLCITLNERQSILDEFVADIGAVLDNPLKRNLLFGVGGKLKRHKHVFANVVALAVVASFKDDHLVGFALNRASHCKRARVECFLDISLRREVRSATLH